MRYARDVKRYRYVGGMSHPPPPCPVGDLVAVRFTKWGERPHWELDLRYLGADEHGHWLGAPRGFRMHRPGMALDSRIDVAMLIPPDRAWMATFNGPGHDTCDIYVDVTTVPDWAGATVRAVDLDLDVYRGLDGSVLVDDEDEFAEHQVRYGYPPDVVALAERSRAELTAAIRAGEEPWASVGHRWVEVASQALPVGHQAPAER